MLRSVVSRFTQSILVEEAEFLFIDKKDPEFYIPPRASVSVAKGLEIAKQRIKWLEVYEHDVDNWLQRDTCLKWIQGYFLLLS